MKSPTEARFSRQWAFIDAAVQRRLWESTVLIAGVGLGSVIAEMLARTGVGGFVLADGDVVEPTNLNRQAFFASDVGCNKAQVTARRIAGIDDRLRLTVVDRFLGAADVDDLVAGVDFVIDTVDWDPAFLACYTAARRRGIPLLLPLNLAWGGALYVFDPHGPDFADVFGIAPSGAHEPAEVRARVVEHAVAALPTPEIERVLPDFRSGDPRRWPCDPQLAAAAAITAAAVTRAVVAWVAGEPVATAPSVIRLDAAVAVCAPR